MNDFFKTIMGRKFYERDVPNIMGALQDIAKELKRANDLKEMELVKNDAEVSAGTEETN